MLCIKVIYIVDNIRLFGGLLYVWYVVIKYFKLIVIIWLKNILYL